MGKTYQIAAAFATLATHRSNTGAPQLLPRGARSRDEKGVSRNVAKPQCKVRNRNWPQKPKNHKTERISVFKSTCVCGIRD